MTGEVEECQGDPAAEDSIEACEGGEPPAGPPRKKLKDRKPGERVCTHTIAE